MLTLLTKEVTTISFKRTDLLYLKKENSLSDEWFYWSNSLEIVLLHFKSKTKTELKEFDNAFRKKFIHFDWFGFFVLMAYQLFLGYLMSKLFT